MSESESSSAQVRVDLWRMIISETAQEQYMVLRERDGARALSMAIGAFEVQAIDRAVKEKPVPRPLTHDLLRHVIEALGARVVAAIITALREDTYYARLDLEGPGGAVHVDARPSDAVALAILTGVPILVDERVMDLISTRDSTDG